MVQDNQRIRSATRDPSPCRGCTERFTACSGNCPKEARGEYGYDSWKDEIKRVKNNKIDYISRTNVRKKHFNEGIKYE